MSTKTNEKRLFKRKIFTDAVKEQLRLKNFQKLPGLAELADEYGVNKPLRFKAWKTLGLHWKKEGHFADAAIALSSARVLQPANIKTLSGLFESLNEFVSEFRDRFSTEDLDLLSEEVQRLLEYYKTEKMWDVPPVVQGKQIFRRINYLKIDAKSSIETPASFKVARIAKALRQNVSMDEVAADFARIMAPVFLELLANDIDEERKTKKKKPKKKTPDEPSEDPEKEKKK